MVRSSSCNCASYPLAFSSNFWISVARLLHLRNQGRGILLRLLQSRDFIGNFVAARLQRFRLQQKSAPFAIDSLEAAERVLQAALAHLLLHQLQIVTHKTEIEHVLSLSD